MNKNATPFILIILALGIYFTYTRAKYNEDQAIQTVNAGYQTAIGNSQKLIQVRDSVRDAYNKITPDDQDRLEKLLPDNVDNVRLTIDLNGVAAKHGLGIKNVKTVTDKGASNSSAPTSAPGASANQIVPNSQGLYNTVTMSFEVTSSYPTFVAFLKDLEVSLRILEISKISLKLNEAGTYDYVVEVKTFWLKQ